ncbi:MAG: carbamoyltransferase HypF, partial [Gammaproteobacteria bacterium]|nr:carbamoyltransferase HypF [Gammaproteobacteria bacterium]
HRPAKPLAVMFPQRGNTLLDAVKEELLPTEVESSILSSPERPIVLCSKLASGALAPSIAPGLIEVGAMLPYSPLHHLLLSHFDGPVVVTSGNISGEPVITDNDDATQRLDKIADAFLHHNRPILRPADDSLYRVILKQPRPMRLGRGIAPLEMRLSQPLPKAILAVGGQMKNSIAIAWNDRVVISPHIGDLESIRSQQIFSQLINELQQLYQVEIEEIVCDAHPGYDSHRIAHHIAQPLNLPVTEVLHHHAHASTLYGERQGEVDWLVFTWDGTGMGADHTLWGGEALVGMPGVWQRFASLKTFRLPGGDKAGREPWRSALALLWERGDATTMAPLSDWNRSADELKLLHNAWQRAINTPQTSAAGRLFDAAAALIGLSHQVSYEGEAPSRLEAICQTSIRSSSSSKSSGKIAPPELPLTEDAEGVWRSDWSPLIQMLLNQKLTQAERATMFHHSMVEIIVKQAELARKKHQIQHIGLTGGVFQNRVLTELAAQRLQKLGFTVHLSIEIPSNDGGLCYGQIVEAAALIKERS